jgi:putative phosphoesterase
MRIGVISDTHGLVRPEALQALAGVERIIHAGDVGGAQVVQALRRVAPVDVVRGNNDKDAWGQQLSPWLALEFDGVGVHVLHDLHDMDVDAAAAGFKVVITGHSHKPLVSEREGVLFVNPGSAGPRRFSLPVTLGYLIIESGAARAEIKSLL